MSATVDIDTKLFVLTGIASLSTLANVIASKLYGPGHSHCSILVGGCLLFVSEFFFVFEEMLGWQQKALWCSHIFLHSLIFWIENTLHPFICNIFIQICQFHPCFVYFGPKDMVPPHYFWCNLAVNRQKKFHCYP
jgi:hypothetical protein